METDMDTTKENLDHLDECFTLHNAKADCLEKLKKQDCIDELEVILYE